LEKVEIKLQRDLFLIKFDPERTFAEQLGELNAHLEKMKVFLKDADNPVAYENITLSFEEEMKLCEILDGFFERKIDFCYKTQPPETLMRHIRAHGEELLLNIERTVRGGENVVSNGDLTVIGDVNPAATVSARKHIYILGALRGKARVKDPNGTVFALRMAPEQIQIADCLSYNTMTAGVAIDSEAYLKNGKIYIRNL